MKYINLEKVNNPLYSKLISNLVIDAKKAMKITKKKEIFLKTNPKNDNVS